MSEGPNPSAALDIWTITAQPSDFPGYFVARKHTVRDGVTGATSFVILRRDLDDLRAEMVKRGLVCITRSPEDDPVIVESWI